MLNPLSLVMMAVRIAYIDMNEALTREAGAGGPVFSNNVVRRLPRYMEVVYLPGSLAIAKIESDEEALRLASALKGLRGTGLWIPERVVEFLERAARLGRRDRVMAYLDLMAKEAEGADFSWIPTTGRTIWRTYARCSDPPLRCCWATSSTWPGGSGEGLWR